MNVHIAAHTLTPAKAATVAEIRKEVKHLTDSERAGREARNAYSRQWYAKHREQRKEYNRRYWERKAQLQRAKESEIGQACGGDAQ
jgi:hypothetical protein